MVRRARNILSPLLRLVSATGLFSLPFCDWCLLPPGAGAVDVLPEAEDGAVAAQGHRRHSQAHQGRPEEHYAAQPQPRRAQHQALARGKPTDRPIASSFLHREPLLGSRASPGTGQLDHLRSCINTGC
eukprot:1035243-Prorocentrum_minimum.AAC.1